MVTGIETAGLVLAAFPVAIECIQLYVRGAEKMKRMKEYQVILEAFLQDLEIEKFLFEHLCEELLAPFCESGQIKELMVNPGGPLWSTEDIQHILKHRLPAQSIPLFLCAVKRLNSELQSLVTTFQVDPSTVSSPNLDDKKVYKKVCVQLVQAFKTGMLLEYREERIRCIRTLNGSLQRLLQTNGGDQENSNVSCKSRKGSICTTKTVEFFNRIRQQARAAFMLLKEHFNSTCNCDDASHGISLKLEMRINSTKELHPSPLKKKPQHLFTVMVSNEGRKKPWSWKEIQLEPIQLDAPTPADAIGEKKCIREIRLSETHSTSAKPPASLQPQPTPGPIVPKITITKPLTPEANDCKEHVGSGTVTKLRHYVATSGVSLVRTTLRSVFRRKNSSYTNLRSWDTPPAQCSAKKVSTGPTCQTNLISVSHEFLSPNHSSPALLGHCQQEAYTARTANNGTFPLVTSFCAVVLSPCHHGACLGILKSTSSEKAQEEFLVWTPKLCVCPADVTSLNSLLGVRFKGGRLPSLESRVWLGIKLASSVMQLHETEWLPEVWSSRDIVFPNSELESHQYALSKPFVRGTLSPPSSISSSTPSEASKLWGMVWANPSLFSLGVVLIELLHWEKLETLRERFEIEYDEAVDVTTNQYATAIKLVDTLDEFQFAEEYEQVVRRCIVGLDHKDKSLDRIGFKSEVYTMVVRPLEQILNAGWSLP